MGAYEVLVVNPGSPDATHAVLASAARAWPNVRVREIGMGAGKCNKGEMINRAFAASRGEWIWLTDADCLFPPDAAERALAHADGCTGPVLLHGERRFLSPVETDSLLAGRVDGLRDFDRVAARGDSRAPEHAPWGYTQIVRRETFARHPYSTAVNHFAHSDGQFADDCRRGGARAEAVPGLVCLHLDHPFAWFGTREML
jgi:glycosyltransferase involved in cell wall biosynthesis